MKNFLIILFLFSSLFSTATATENSNSIKSDLYSVTADNNIKIIKKNVRAVRFVYNSNDIEATITVTIIEKNGRLLVDYGDFFAAIVYDSDRPNYKYSFRLSGFTYYFNLN